jgi:putative DNA primase/helicase
MGVVSQIYRALVRGVCTVTPPTSGEVIINFRQAVIEKPGYAPSVIECTGKLERFSCNGKSDDKAGWYVCHEYTLTIGSDHHWGIVGIFGNWREGSTHKWNSFSEFFNLTREEKQQLERKQQEQVAQKQAERAIKAEQAHQRAVKMWLSAQPANPSHPYLMRKRVGAYGIRQAGNLLLVPLCDLSGTLHSLQTIAPNGEKRFLPGTPKQGMFHLVGDSLTHPHGVYLCEGYATGASLHEAYHLPVLVAFDAGNLLSVARSYRNRFPHIPLTVCADNDRKTPGNPGLTKAREVVTSLPGVGLIVPEFPEGTPLHLSDFNDLTALLGSNAHKETTP